MTISLIAFLILTSKISELDKLGAEVTLHWLKNSSLFTDLYQTTNKKSDSVLRKEFLVKLCYNGTSLHKTHAKRTSCKIPLSSQPRLRAHGQESWAFHLALILLLRQKLETLKEIWARMFPEKGFLTLKLLWHLQNSLGTPSPCCCPHHTCQKINIKAPVALEEEGSNW